MRLEASGRWSFRPLALVASLALVAACTTAATPVPTQSPTAAPTSGATAGPTTPATQVPPFTVRFLASVGALGDWAPYVGMANGLFQKANINFKYTTFANQADVFNSIVSGKGDLAISSLPTALSAALNKAPAKLISATQVATPKGEYDSRWVVLPSSNIRSIADLKGKKVNIFAQSSLAQAITRSVLASNGVPVGSYTEVSVPFPQAFTALESGQVDITLLIEPFYSNSQEISKQKYGGELRVIYQYMTFFTEGVNVTGMLANTTWAANNRDNLKRFFEVWFEAVKWGNDPANRDLLRRIMASGAGVAYDSVKSMVPAGMSPDGKFFPGFLPKFQNLVIEHNQIPNLTAPLPEDQFVDLSFLPS
jgi:ABC-type nitrate/sulfonate/bicarbonate transport system substrate-binding protein